MHGVHQIVQRHAALLSPASYDHAIDRLFLRPLNDRSQDRAADQIASIEDLILSASEPDRQEPILIGARKDCGERMFDEVATCLPPISAVLVNPLPVQRQIICQVHVQNCSRRITIRTVYFDLAIDTPRTQHRRVDQVRPVRRQNDHHIMQRLDPVHLGTEHGHQGTGDVERTRRPPRAEYRFRLVDKDKGQRPLVPASASLGKKIPDHPLRFSQPHIQNLWPLDMEKRPASHRWSLPLRTRRALD